MSQPRTSIREQPSRTTSLPQLLRRQDVEKCTGLSRSAIYKNLADSDSDFPRPIRVGAKAVRWKSNEIEQWVQSRPLAR